MRKGISHTRTKIVDPLSDLRTGAALIVIMGFTDGECIIISLQILRIILFQGVNAFETASKLDGQIPAEKSEHQA